MAIYHCSVKNISRGSGKSAVASASYRSGEKLEDERQGLTFEYHKSEVAYSEIFLCQNAPQEYADRGTLWNAVEQVEKQNNARLAREWEVALPNELTLEQSKELVKEFSQSLADEGMCVDANIHWKDGNHHAHIMGTTRPIKENGEWGQKEKKDYALDENGERIPILNEDGTQKLDSRNRKQWKRELVDSTGWNREEKLEEWRERWEVMTNQALEKANIQERVSAKSFEEQGIERIPTIHEGHYARQLEEKGEVSDRCEINREIKAANTELEQLDRQQSLYERLVEQLKNKLKEKLEELNERFNKYRTTRTADGPVGGIADGEQPIQANYQEPVRTDSQSAESVDRQLEALRSARGSRGTEQGEQRPAEQSQETGERENSSTVRVSQREKEILTRSIQLGTVEQDDRDGESQDQDHNQSSGQEQGGGIDYEAIESELADREATERKSAEKRDNSISERADREAEQKRLTAQRVEKQHTKSKSIGRGR